MRDLFDDAVCAPPTAPRHLHYPGGRQVHRKPDKQFPQSGNKQDRSLFHADRIGDATTVYVAEGEKDVLAVEAVGGTAVCSAMGAGNAHLADWSPLTRHATSSSSPTRTKPAASTPPKTAQLLNGIATSIQVAEAKTGKDVADHIAAGYTLDELVINLSTRPTGTPRAMARNRSQTRRPAPLARPRPAYPAPPSPCWSATKASARACCGCGSSPPSPPGNRLPAFGIPAREPAPVIIADHRGRLADHRAATAGGGRRRPGHDPRHLHRGRRQRGTGLPARPVPDRRSRPETALVVVDAWLDTVPPGCRCATPSRPARPCTRGRTSPPPPTPPCCCCATPTGSTTANARDRYGATGELRKKARMTLFAQTDEDGNLVVGPEKMNTAAPDPGVEVHHHRGAALRRHRGPRRHRAAAALRRRLRPDRTRTPRRELRRRT